MKLISLNIEGDRHWGRILPFLEAERPDVICLQEVFETDLHNLEALGYITRFLSMTTKERLGAIETFGVSIAAKSPFPHTCKYYHRSESNRYERKDKNRTMSYGVLYAEIPYGDEIYSTATTHLTWTKNGLPDKPQRTHFRNMLKLCNELPPHVLCGDFNIPRGYNNLYDELTKYYTDSIPSSYKTSIDMNLHKVKDDPVESKRVSKYMVDYIFTKPPYQAKNVRLEFGLSDHAAVVGSITRQ